MKNLISILQDEKSSIKLEVSGEDLLEFSNELIARILGVHRLTVAQFVKEISYV